MKKLSLCSLTDFVLSPLFLFIRLQETKLNITFSNLSSIVKFCLTLTMCALSYPQSTCRVACRLKRNMCYSGVKQSQDDLIFFFKVMQFSMTFPYILSKIDISFPLLQLKIATKLPEDNRHSEPLFGVLYRRRKCFALTLS